MPQIRALFGLLAASLAACGTCPHTSWWWTLDRATGCLRTAAITECTSGPGPAVERCSAGQDGALYLSPEGRLVPGGRECTTAEQSEVSSRQACAGDAHAAFGS